MIEISTNTGRHPHNQVNPHEPTQPYAHQVYPKMKYHTSLMVEDPLAAKTTHPEGVKVNSKEEEDALGPGWVDNPGQNFRPGTVVERVKTPVEVQAEKDQEVNDLKAELERLRAQVAQGSKGKKQE